MIYYTTVVGLDPKALATLFLISKVMDGISDPVMGFILDRFPVTKMGKFRPMLILGTIICVINYILLWFGAVWSPVGKYVIVYWMSRTNGAETKDIPAFRVQGA